MDMAQFSEIKFKAGGDIAAFLKQNEIRLKTLSLQKSFRFYLRLCLEIKAHSKTASDFLLPNHTDSNNYLIPLESAYNYADTCLKSEGIKPEKVNEILEQLPQIAEKDLFNRMLKNSALNDGESVNNRYISFDAFVGYLMGCFQKIIVARVYTFHTNLRLLCKSKHESACTFESFSYTVRRL